MAHYNEDTESISTVYVTNVPFEPTTRSARAILGIAQKMASWDDPKGIMGSALWTFLKKNADYEDSSDTMGLPGEIAKLDQKVKKLVRSIIQHKPLNGESAQELLHDIFGHALLAMYYGEKEAAEDTAGVDEAPTWAESTRQRASEIRNSDTMSVEQEADFRRAAYTLRHEGWSWVRLRKIMQEWEEEENKEQAEKRAAVRAAALLRRKKFDRMVGVLREDGMSLDEMRSALREQRGRVARERSGSLNQELTLPKNPFSEDEED